MLYPSNSSRWISILVLFYFRLSLSLVLGILESGAGREIIQSTPPASSQSSDLFTIPTIARADIPNTAGSLNPLRQNIGTSTSVRPSSHDVATNKKVPRLFSITHDTGEAVMDSEVPQHETDKALEQQYDTYGLEEIFTQPRSHQPMMSESAMLMDEPQSSRPRLHPFFESGRQVASHEANKKQKIETPRDDRISKHSSSASKKRTPKMTAQNLRAYMARKKFSTKQSSYPSGIEFPNLFDITTFREFYDEQGSESWKAMDKTNFQELVKDELLGMQHDFKSASLSELPPFRQERGEGEAFSDFKRGVNAYIDKPGISPEERELRKTRMLIYITRWSKLLTWLDAEMPVHNGIANFYQIAFKVADKLIMADNSVALRELKMAIRKMAEFWLYLPEESIKTNEERLIWFESILLPRVWMRQYRIQSDLNDPPFLKSLLRFKLSESARTGEDQEARRMNLKDLISQTHEQWVTEHPQHPLNVQVTPSESDRMFIHLSPAHPLNMQAASSAMMFKHIPRVLPRVSFKAWSTGKSTTPRFKKDPVMEYLIKLKTEEGDLKRNLVYQTGLYPSTYYHKPRYLVPVVDLEN